MEQGEQGRGEVPDAHDATPESEAVLGGVSSAAEPPPITRSRRLSAMGSTYVLIFAGFLLLLTALLADDTSNAAALGTALCGFGLLGIAAISITGVAGPGTVATLCLAAGVALAISGLFPSDREFPELARLVAGAGTFIASFGSLAAARQADGGRDRPDDEPRPGVGSL